MRLSVIDAGNFKLDGGSMFGVVPKSIWQKAIPADKNNMCNFKMRCLLVEDGKRLTLIDTGMGYKQPEKWQSYYYRNGDGNLKDSLKKAGYSIGDVSDVILSHLHFDHAGGAVEWNTSKDFYQPTFPNAKYWTHSGQFESTQNPNPREKATFLPENITPLHEAGQLYFIDEENYNFGQNYEFIFVDGHTEKMMMVLLNTGKSKVLFAADTIPTAAHIHVPYVMAYDIAPLKTMDEKQRILNRIVDEEILLFFDHDVETEVSQIIRTEKRFWPENSGVLKDFLS